METQFRLGLLYMGTRDLSPFMSFFQPEMATDGAICPVQENLCYLLIVHGSLSEQNSSTSLGPFLIEKQYEGGKIKPITLCPTVLV